jgi:hypothetical protein
VALLRTAAGKAGCEAVLALADIKTTHGAFPADESYGYRRRGWHDDEDDGEYSSDTSDSEREYDIQELIDSDITLTHWTGPDGTRLEETSLSVDGDEACASTSTGDLKPFSSDYEGYMGNWGNTLDRWYHRAAVVVWPRDQAFANRAETSPAWAFDERAAMASAGDVPGAQGAAATLEQPGAKGGKATSATPVRGYVTQNHRCNRAVRVTARWARGARRGNAWPRRGRRASCQRAIRPRDGRHGRRGRRPCPGEPAPVSARLARRWSGGERGGDVGGVPVQAGAGLVVARVAWLRRAESGRIPRSVP